MPPSRTPGTGAGAAVVLALPLHIGAAGSGPIASELSMPCAAAFDDPGWCFSVDWQGMRAVLRANADGEVHIHDERLRDVTARVGEVAAGAVLALGGRAAALDGVVAVLDADGCPDLPALAARLWSSPPPGARTEVGPAAVPAVMLVTDLLHLDGVTLHAWPFDRRREALGTLLTHSPHLQLPEWVVGQGRALAAAATERGLPAIVGRDRGAHYHPGVASPQRLRVALRDETEVIVAGVVTGPRGVIDALLVAEWKGPDLVHAGRVLFDGDPAAGRWLAARVRELRAGRPEVSGGSAEPRALWLRASVVATVRHHGRSEHGTLRLPSLVALRDDVDPRRCVRRAAVAPPRAGGAVDAGRFRPTVISTLPF